jgi:hypothetical protein
MDTWLYGPLAPAGYAPFGAGCQGTAGVPALAAVDQLPWLGESFTLSLTRLPPAAPVFVLLGSSNATWGTLRLPLPLDFLGMTGCSLLASGEFAFPIASSGGSANLALPIPNAPSLLGGSFFNQGVVADWAANAFGATVSNAARGIPGAK